MAWHLDVLSIHQYTGCAKWSINRLLAEWQKKGTIARDLTAQHWRGRKQTLSGLNIQVRAMHLIFILPYWLEVMLKSKPSFSRAPSGPTFLSHLDSAKLQLDIKAGKNVLVYDWSSGKLLSVVICNFFQDPNLLAHVNGIIKQSVECHRSIRYANAANLTSL